LIFFFACGLDKVKKESMAFANIKYKTALFGTMTKLRLEIKYIEYQVNQKKKTMGVEIFKAMAEGDHKGAEVTITIDGERVLFNF
jgi:predicted fused transcriptional regulator/phosphomethylpyrimidine kinase